MVSAASLALGGLIVSATSSAFWNCLLVVNPAT